jgi:ferritin
MEIKGPEKGPGGCARWRPCAGSGSGLPFAAEERKQAANWKPSMALSKKLNAAINQQIGSEFGASLQYVAIANHFAEEGLPACCAFFTKQGDEERAHAMRFVKYVLDSGGHVEIPSIPAPKHAFKSVVDAIELSLNWEQEVTAQINRLMDLAVKEDDFLTQNFLHWFLTEQVEEIATMDTLLKAAQRAGPNVLLLEDFVGRHGDKLRGGGAEKAKAE